MLMYRGLMPGGNSVKRTKCFLPQTAMGFGCPTNSTFTGRPLINTVNNASAKRRTWGLMIIIFWEMMPCGSYKNHLPEDDNHHSHRRGILKSNMGFILNVKSGNKQMLVG
jgi:hypothetical protein